MPGLDAEDAAALTLEVQLASAEGEIERLHSELNQATELLHRSNVAAAADAKTLAEQRAELGRLRADLLLAKKSHADTVGDLHSLRAELEQSRIAERVAVDRWKQGNEAYDGCDRERNRLRAELADSNGDAMNLQSIIDELRAELDWFRRLYPHISDVLDDAEMSWSRPDLRRFLETNPKPGADT